MRDQTMWTALPGERFELGEGLRRLDDGRTIMVDILSGRLLLLPESLDEQPSVLLELNGPLGAVAPRGDGWIAAAGPGIALLDGTEVTWLARPEQGEHPAMRMNDGVADPHGRFWAGSMAYGAVPGAGALYRVDRNRSVAQVLTGLTVPNGPAFTADGATMYLADSAHGVIYRYPVDPDSAALGPRSTFATVPVGSPDGMTVDDEGCLWSAIWGAGELHRYTPDGDLERVVPVPAAQPTSVCLAGDRLIVTTARTGLSDPTDLDGAVLHMPAPATAPPASTFR
ncbi:SMP-30/gluconolactonase/LRE family protein [Pseudonocardia spinosispora]|uniref:SMP-30/gluconolactonase/LRE family protein n=1 Tax=Pseudonocardia spinosispora TaxID=103441 RepID=UPI0004281462|nr:SMP-30/gluconolactonase/LRE family protein [Pseudonocardia spinosispora]